MTPAGDNVGRGCHERESGDAGFPPVDASTLAALRIVPRTAEQQAALYVRYVRALALLAECAGDVDDPDHRDLIAAVLEDAQAHYPLDVEPCGVRWQVAPRAL